MRLGNTKFLISSFLPMAAPAICAALAASGWEMSAWRLFLARLWGFDRRPSTNRTLFAIWRISSTSVGVNTFLTCRNMNILSALALDRWAGRNASKWRGMLHLLGLLLIVSKDASGH